MTPEVYATAVVARNAASHPMHTRLRPRHTCSAVTSGFFPPQPLRAPSHERQRQAAQRQVTHQRHVTAPLEVPEPQLRLAQPYAVLHVPPAEHHAHHPLHGLVGRCVADEVLLLARPLVARPDEPVRPVAAPARAHPRRLHLPDLFAQRLPGQTHLLPALAAKQPAVPHQVVGTARPAARGRRLSEAAERPRHLTGVTLVPPVEALEETGLVAVALVEGEPVEADAVGTGAVELLQGDLPLGAVDDVVGDVGGATAFAVTVPGLGQEQVGVEEGLVAAAGQAGVDGDDAVLELAGLAAVLPLHAGAVRALLLGGCLVDDPDPADLLRP